MIYRLVTGRYPFFVADGNELELYKQICRGTLELDGLMTMEFRLLMTTTLYPDPSKRLGSGRNGWIEIINSAWFDELDLRKLRRQKIKAPWMPDFKNDIDASSFHPDESEMVDLMLQVSLVLSIFDHDHLNRMFLTISCYSQEFPALDDGQQKMFVPFGRQV